MRSFGETCALMEPKGTRIPDLERTESFAPTFHVSWMSRCGFPLLIIVFVIVVSFVYGLSVGVRRQQAVASRALDGLAGSTGTLAASLSVELPAGLTLIPLGDDVEVNGKPSEIVMFRSERPVEALVNEQVQLLQRRGWRASGRSSAKRGVVLGYDPVTGRRSLFSVRAVPPSVRHAMSGGARVEGMIAVSALRGEFPSSPELGSGIVPGVPLIPGGRGGAVFSAVGVGGRSYSGGYTNPGTVEENIAHYVSVLNAEGWERKSVLESGSVGRKVGSIRMVKGQEEVVLLFVPVPEEFRQGGGPETVVSVARGPNLSRY